MIGRKSPVSRVRDRCVRVSEILRHLHDGYAVCHHRDCGAVADGVQADVLQVGSFDGVVEALSDALDPLGAPFDHMVGKRCVLSMFQLFPQTLVDRHDRAAFAGFGVV